MQSLRCALDQGQMSVSSSGAAIYLFRQGFQQAHCFFTYVRSLRLIFITLIIMPHCFTMESVCLRSMVSAVRCRRIDR